MLSYSRDMTGFSRTETVTRDGDETLVRTTTVLSQHEGFKVHLVHEATFKPKAPDPVGEICYRCTVFSDGSLVCIPIPLSKAEAP